MCDGAQATSGMSSFLLARVPRDRKALKREFCVKAEAEQTRADQAEQTSPKPVGGCRRAACWCRSQGSRNSRMVPGFPELVVVQ